MAARSVRIPRAQARVVRPAVAVEPGARFVENRAGWVRAQRLFLLFAAAVGVLYAALVGDALAVNPGLGSDPTALGAFTLVAVAFVVVAATLTIARAPRGVWWTETELVVRERFTAPRRYPKDVPARIARRFAAGALAPAPTEIVELVPRGGRRMTYLVDEGTFPEQRA